MSAKRALREAKTLVRQGDLQSALQICQDVLNQTSPQDERALENVLSVLAKIKSAQANVQAGTELPREQADRLLALFRSGKINETFQGATTLAGRYPDSSFLHNLLGAIHLAVGNPSEAVPRHERAIALNPDNAQAHVDLALAREALGDFDGAIESLERAIALRPNDIAAHSNLCDILERLNRIGDLREAVGRAKKTCGDGHPLIRFRMAQLAAREKDHAAARQHLEAMQADGLTQQLAEHRLALLGKACDKLGDHKAAFAAFSEANTIIAASQQARTSVPSRYRQAIETLITAFTEAPDTSFADAPKAERATPVFLVGFPRSGTTLLDTILRGHPKVEVVEEKPMVAMLRGQVGTDAGPQRLAALSGDDIAALRKLYFREIDKHLPEGDDDRVVIDKLPLNIISAGLIHRVFPDAKFILATRHPCDCVLSCFMQRFGLNDAMANFLDLEDSAALYDRVMTLWSAYREKLPLQVHEVRYENLVTDLEGAARPLIAFLGLEWDDAVANYRDTAMARGHINTPSYAQVTEKLHSQASGRWENYREQMTPALPVLEPWAKALGYSA